MPPFSKPAQSYAEQLGILASRGLVIEDLVFAEKCLRLTTITGYRPIASR